jgi:maltooligosyltrehalose trehalohydrolase
VIDRRANLPIVGATVAGGGTTHFKVWAPSAKRVEVVLGTNCLAVELEAMDDGYFSGDAHAPAGTLYWFRLDGGPSYPDPASRFQPSGPHGPSEVIDPHAYAWTDETWTGLVPNGQALYEMHIGTFTQQGSYATAAEHLPYLKDLGITAIEVMPLNEFDGEFGWGYDGVNLFAPYRRYGRPDELRAFVDRAHSIGLGIILDVVYNHFGPSGNYLSRFSPFYMTTKGTTEWGEAIDFDGENSAAVRDFFKANAAYWIKEFHIDGLRLDATQCIFDESNRHILVEICESARNAGNGRRIYITAENEPQLARVLRAPETGGFGIDAVWNDDLHHSLVVAATGTADAYYSETRGTPQELISGIKWGFLYQGQYFAWQKQPRGSPVLDMEACRFISFLQNHDQVANSARGLRLHALTSPGRMRALTALLLLSPATPLLFQGQEFAADSPFLFFAGHQGELAEQVRAGRAEFLRQFPNLAGATAPRYSAILKTSKPLRPASYATNNAWRTRMCSQCTARCSNCGVAMQCSVRKMPAAFTVLCWALRHSPCDSWVRTAMTASSS